MNELQIWAVIYLWAIIQEQHFLGARSLESTSHELKTTKCKQWTTINLQAVIYELGTTIYELHFMSCKPQTVDYKLQFISCKSFRRLDATALSLYLTTDTNTTSFLAISRTLKVERRPCDHLLCACPPLALSSSLLCTLVGSRAVEYSDVTTLSPSDGRHQHAKLLGYFKDAKG